MKNNCLILGCGYVGTYYLSKFSDSDLTSRKPVESRPNKELNESRKTTLNEPILFNLTDRTTWNNITDSEKVLWAFAPAATAEEVELAIEFYNTHLKENRNVIVLSSTGAYVFNKENELVDENYPTKMDQPRYRAEERLRESGAMILHLSGIIGEHRYPKKWYDNKWVKHGETILNYVHVDDIVYFIDKLFANFQPGERFNLTSADYKTHKQIVALLKMEMEFAFPDQSFESKRVSNSKLLGFLKLEDYKFIKYPEDC